jgi:hypothetical protein
VFAASGPEEPTGTFKRWQDCEVLAKDVVSAGGRRAEAAAAVASAAETQQGQLFTRAVSLRGKQEISPFQPIPLLHSSSQGIGGSCIKAHAGSRRKGAELHFPTPPKDSGMAYCRAAPAAAAVALPKRRGLEVTRSDWK